MEAEDFWVKTALDLLCEGCLRQHWAHVPDQFLFPLLSVSHQSRD